MADEPAVAPDYWVSKLAENGWAVIKGGSPELDEETPKQETPKEADPPNEEIPAEPPDDGAPDTNWEKRYTDLQPAYTQATQRLSQYDELIQRARQGDPEALDTLGLPYEEPEEEDEFVDPSEQMLAEWQEFKAQQEEREQQDEFTQLEEMEKEFISDKISTLEKDTGISLTDKGKRAVRAMSRESRRDDGEPMVEDAFKEFAAELEADRERYLKSKKEAALAPVGGPGEDKIDLSDDEQRQAAMVRDIEAEEGSDL